MKKNRLELVRSRSPFHLLSLPKDALTTFADAPRWMRQHRSAQIISCPIAKESMTGFAPATIGVILECNKASEANVLTTTPHRRWYACKADEASGDKKGLYTSGIWEADGRYGRRERSSFRLMVPGMNTDSLPLSSAASHTVLLSPHPRQSSNVTHYIDHKSATTSFPR